MDKQRIYDILNGHAINDVFFEEKPVWIQNVKDDVARIGFMDNSEERDVFIEDLYESDLYN